MKLATAWFLFTGAAVAFLSVTEVAAKEQPGKKPEGRGNPAIGQSGEGEPEETGGKPCKECQGKGTVPEKGKKGSK